MSDSTSIVAAVAACVSAVGGAFAAVAAFRSADSAREAQESALEAEKNTFLRQLSLNATEAVLEANRACARGDEVKLLYRSLSTFAGSSGGSREGLYIKKVDEKLAALRDLAKSAQPFEDAPDTLQSSPLGEIRAKEVTVARLLKRARVLREELDREHSYVNGQCSTYREKAILRPGP